MYQNKTVAFVHRFRDKIAASIGDGSTTYLTEKQARQLSKALLECAQSVKREKFTCSNFGSREIK